MTFLGHIPGHLMNNYYSKADIYIQPSIIDKDGTTEGLGVTILGDGLRTPCIDQSWHSRHIRDGENGLVNPTDQNSWQKKIVFAAS